MALVKLASSRITKDMTVGEVVRRFPSAAETLLKYDVDCTGCGAGYYETLAKALGAQDVDEIVSELNAQLPEEQGSDLIVTKNAADWLKKILEARNKESAGLRIRVEPGGCAGKSYKFAIEDVPKEDDAVLNVHDARFFIDKKSMLLLKGSRLDYVDALTGAGFKVSNPNAKATCGCGQSFA